MEGSGYFFLAGRFKEVSEKRWLPILIASILVLVSCTGKDNFTIGSRFTEDQTKLKIVDTFRVDVSTVMADSIATSGTGVLLAGMYGDSSFGNLSMYGYFEPGYSAVTIDDTYIFDSASVILPYSGYSYGDTTTLCTMSLYQLRNYINLNNNYYMYNNEDVAASDTLIGTVSFYPIPSSKDTVIIEAKSFGQMMFTKFQNNDPDVASGETIVNFLKGFVLKPVSGNAIIGFKAAASQVLLRMYYHVDGETVINSVINMPLGASNKQFNTIHTDFSNTPLALLKPDSKAVPSSLTGNTAFMQALVGLYPKLTFPSLQDITYSENWKILKAELVMTPVVGSYSDSTLPAQLCLYRTDKNNQIGTVLANSDGSVIYTKLVTDKIFNEDTNYTIDITSYLNASLVNNYFDSNSGLLLFLGSSSMNKSLSRLMLDCSNSKVKLLLYYLSY